MRSGTCFSSFWRKLRERLTLYTSQPSKDAAKMTVDAFEAANQTLKWNGFVMAPTKLMTKLRA